MLWFSAGQMQCLVEVGDFFVYGHGERIQCFQVFCMVFVKFCLKEIQDNICTRVEIKSPSVKI